MWRDTARSPKIGPLDARTLFPIAIWAFHMREWTLIVALVGVVIFALLMWRGYTPAIAARMVRRRIAGSTRWSTRPVETRRWGRRA